MFHVYLCNAAFACSLQPCAQLWGKGWPLGTHVCCAFLCFVTFPYDNPGQVLYFIVSIPIRIYHESEGRIEKSVTGIAVCHHEACLVMTNSDPEGRIFLS